MVIGPMTEGLSGRIQFPDFSVGNVRHVYEMIKNILMKPRLYDNVYLETAKTNPRPGELYCRWYLPGEEMIESFFEQISFAHMFSIDPVIHLIKAGLLFRFPSQAIFDADKRYSLGIRAELIRNILLHLNSRQITLPIEGDSRFASSRLLDLTDPEIYIELCDKIFKPLDSPKLGQEQGSRPDSLRMDVLLVHNFIRNFAKSGLHPSTLGNERIRKFQESEILEIVGNISDPAERWEFLCQLRGNSGSLRLLAEIRKKRASEDSETLDKAKRARSEKN
jgi:hypothetical protein